MKSIVTGGAGFIGSHLVRLLLSKGHELVVLDNFSTGRPENLLDISHEITLIECDLSSVGAWVDAFIGADFVFHLAALADIVPSIQNPNAYFNANVVATFNVLTASRANTVKKFIYTASSSCYGTPTLYPTPETSAIQPEYPYALTKRIGEELILHWAKVFQFPANSLRLFNVYGPRSRTSGTYGAVFGVFLAQKLAGQPLTVVGDGTQTRDFTYVSDVVNALYAASQTSLVGEVFNVGSGSEVSINRLVELLGSEQIHIPKRPAEPSRTFADIGKITDQLGWTPQVGIVDGVNRLLDDINYWKDAPVWTKDKIESATSDWFKYLARDGN